MQNRIKELRAKYNLTQEQLAEKIGISRPALSDIETGKTIPRGQTIIRIANVFGMPAEQIFFEDEDDVVDRGNVNISSPHRRRNAVYGT